MHILKGEEEGLLTVQIVMPNQDRWMETLAEYYTSDGYSDSATAWNEHRKEALGVALKTYLMPNMAKYMREKLRLESQEVVCHQAFRSLQSKVDVGPFRGPDASRYKDGVPRVAAVSSGNGEHGDPVVAVYLDDDGRVEDRLELPNIKEERYCTRMIEFLRTNQPNVVGVAGFNANARHLLKRMQELLEQINHQPRLDLVAVDDEAARLYKNSKRAQLEFDGYSEVMRYCISLARRLQCPVLEYTGLGRDLLAIQHHTLQHLVPEDMLLAALERALIHTVNNLGLDINAAVQSPYLATALQYIAGFGPRKAQTLLKKLETRGELESRAALVTRGLTPATIFMNCASFLRIRDIDGMDILDDTRVHPQDYDLARKMAGDALEIEEEEMDDYDSKVAIVTRVVKEYPEKLNDLILDDYGLMLQMQYKTSKRQILELIKNELQGPFHDRRHRYVRPTIDETFTMMTGETPATLREGFIVPVKVTGLRAKMAHCVLDSGLEGIIFIDQASDQRINRIDDALQKGSTINALVLRIDKDKFVVELSSKPSMTKPDSDIQLRKLPDDPYYDVEGEAQELSRQGAQRKKRERSKRHINHPMFQQLNFKEAEDYLASRARGDYVIRPSSRGTSHIAITWKVDEDVYQHVDVVELRNPNEPVRYQVGDAVFDDLDQVIVMHVESIAHKADDLMQHPKFRSGGLHALSKYWFGIFGSHS